MAIGYDNGVLTVDAEDQEYLQQKYDGMSPSKRNRFVKAGLGGLSFYDAICLFMCKYKLDPQSAAELLVKQLQSGEIQMVAERKS